MDAVRTSAGLADAAGEAAGLDAAACIAAVAERLAPRLDELTTELVHVYAARIPGYADIPADVVASNTRAVLDAVVRRFRDGRPAHQDGIEEFTALVWRWAESDVPLSLIAHSLHLGARHFVAAARGEAAVLGLPAAFLTWMQEQAWEWATVNATVITEVQREHAVARARRDAARLADVLRDLAAGSMSALRLSEAADAYGLDLETPYVAVLAECPDARAAEALEQRVRATGGGRGAGAVTSVVGARLLGVCPDRPRTDGDELLAVGPPLPLRDAHRSFADADLALRTASAFAVTGTVSLADLGALPYVVAAERVTAGLTRRHLAPLEGRPGADEIEATVLTFLELDQGVEETARRLHLHRNTVRHRVGRFRELTGLDVTRTADLTTAWLLLRRRHGSGPAAR